MANVEIITRIITRNDTEQNWRNENPVLLKGEFGIEIDTNKIKIGDGTTPWNLLKVSNVRPEDLGEMGYGDMTKAVYDTNNNGVVDSAEKVVNKLTVGSKQYDGSAAVTITATDLNAVQTNTPITSGTHTVISYDSKGLVTSGRSLQEGDIPSLSAAKITGLGTAATKNVGTDIGNIAEVLPNGKISELLIPSIAITDTDVINSEAEMLALDAEIGDIAIRLDVEKTFILQKTPASILENWVMMPSPVGGVSSVNGHTGVVTLFTSDIDEGSNKYYTEERVNANFATHASTELTDSNDLVRVTDSLILNGGNA